MQQDNIITWHLKKKGQEKNKIKSEILGPLTYVYPNPSQNK